jgi:SET domain-containing protein
LFAARRIAAGEYIGTFHGPRVDADARHVLWVYPQDGPPVGRRGQNVLRFLNHATPCSAAFDGFDLFASRPIAADEEVTIDYVDAE